MQDQTPTSATGSAAITNPIDVADNMKEHSSKEEVSNLRSPSGPEWSYDAPIRCLSDNFGTSGTFSNQKFLPHGPYQPLSASLPILDLLSTKKLSLRSPELSPVCTLGSPTATDDSGDHVISLGPHCKGSLQSDSPKNDAANITHMIAGLVLLCISGLMDAVTISYAVWLNQSGIPTPKLVMYQGIVQVLLCLLFGLITVTMMAKGGSINHGLSRNASFRSLVLPFSSEYHEKFLSVVRFQKKKIMDSNAFTMNHNKYGTLSDLSSSTMPTMRKRSIGRGDSCSLRQMLLPVVVFGIIQFGSHLTFFNGYLDHTSSGGNDSANADDVAVAPLFNSIAIVFAFLWSHFFHETTVNSELVSYLFLMYIGVAVCGYSFVVNGVDGVAVLVRKSNVFLVFSALLESVAYLLIKYARRIPTFLLVFSQSLCCAILGVVMVSFSNDVTLAIPSVSQLLEVSSVGVMGFWTTWTFVRGTQLISIGTASFVKMTIFMICSIMIQVFSIEGGLPHFDFYCVFGMILIALSIVLLLIEKFSKFHQ